MVSQLADFPFLTALLLCCGVGLLAILSIPGRHTRAIKIVGAVFSGLTLVISVYLYIAYDQQAGGYQFVERVEWIPALGIAYFNAVDGFALPMLLLTGIVFFHGRADLLGDGTAGQGIFRPHIPARGRRLRPVHEPGPVFHLRLVRCLPVSHVSAHRHLGQHAQGIRGHEADPLPAGRQRADPAGHRLPGGQRGHLTFDLLALMDGDRFTPAQQRLAFLMLYIGFGILAGVFPFHTWSPVGHVAAPTAVSMIHAGVLMKIGAFGILRVGIFLCPDGWQFWAPLMAVLAVCGIVYGALVGLSQTDLKYVIGYSSVSHMGIVGLGLSTMTVDGVNGAVFQMFAHGIMTALFFSSVGYIYDRTHTKAIAELGGLSRIMPRASSFFIYCRPDRHRRSLPGQLLGGTGGVHVLRAGLPGGRGAGHRGAGGGALFMLRVVQKTCYGPPLGEICRSDGHHRRPGGAPRDSGVGDRAVRAFPGLLFDMIHTATVQLTGLR
jgi:NADH-quinone oxidoreductase subunit M